MSSKESAFAQGLIEMRPQIIVYRIIGTNVPFTRCVELTTTRGLTSF